MANINTYYIIKLPDVTSIQIERGIIAKKRLIMLLLLVVVVISLGSVASAESRFNWGELRGGKWTTEIKGYGYRCNAKTTYSKSDYSVGVSLTAKYTGADFIGTKSISQGTGGYHYAY